MSDNARMRSLAIVFLAALTVSAQAPQPFDILIRNGRVLDGTGNPWYRADIGITGERIRAMGQLTGATAKTVIDADAVRAISEWATEGLVPDLTILLDIDADAARGRLDTARTRYDRLEAEASAFHDRVRDAYLAIVAQSFVSPVDTDV